VKIKLGHGRQRGLIILGILVVVLALGLGGCAVIEILKKGKEIEERQHQKETNCVPELVFDPIPPLEPGLPPITEEVLADGNWVTVQGGTVIATNAAPNYDLEDESGY
jgi:hypothetical protein